MVGTIIVCGFIIVAMAAPVIAPPETDDPYQLPQDGYVGNPEPPSPGHLLGLLQDRYDVFYGIIWGTRVAFQIGLVITLRLMNVGN